MKKIYAPLLTALLLVSFAPGCRRSAPAPAATVAASAQTSALAFGAVCVHDEDCASHTCSVGNSGAFCSIKCTKETEQTDCPTPLTAGKCNRRGFCKRP